MIRNTNVHYKTGSLRTEDAKASEITTDPVEFLVDKDKVFFHDRLRGMVFRRGPDSQPLPHRYMRAIVLRLPKSLRPGRYQ